MPIYEYECRACGHYLDALQKMSDPPLTDCPDCGEAALRKLVSAPRFRLKGSGWYETDFKGENRRNIHDSGDAGTKKSGDKGDGSAAPAGKSASGDSTPKADAKPSSGSKNAGGKA